MRRRGLARLREMREPAPQVIAGIAPPNDTDAEAYCLEACMSSEERMADVMTILKPMHFYSDANAAIYEAAVALYEVGAMVNALSVQQWLTDRERLQSVGGAGYVKQFDIGTPAKGDHKAQARRVYDLWRRRQIIATCQRAAGEGYHDVGETGAWIDSVESHIHEIAHPEQQSEVAPVRSIVREIFESVHAAAERGEQISGAPTGITKLDEKLAGLHNGDLYIVAGRPGMGKSALVGGFAVNIASPSGPDDDLVPGDAVVISSLEMQRDQFVKRMLCSEARVDINKMRTFAFNADEWRRLTEASRFIETLPIWVDDTPSVDLLSMRAKLRKIEADLRRSGDHRGKRACRIGLVIVDYLQLMGGTGDEDNREQEIAGISRGLKRLAKEFKVPVIALSQLNRSCENRSAKDKRPQLSDLRESGAIEQDADAIIFCYRDEYYNPETTDAKGIAELIIAKQRNGPTGKVFARFTSFCARFDDLDPRDYPDMPDE